MNSATMPALPCLPLAEELVPAPAPWQVARQLADRPHLLFFDSALSSPPLGRSSFVTADPSAWLHARGRCILLNGERQPQTDPFTVLQRLLAEQHQHLDTLPGLPPFQGGAAGLFGYDLCHHLERLPRPRFDEFRMPDLAVGLYDWVVSFDHTAGRAWLISTGLPETEPDRQRRRARQRLEGVRRLLARPAPKPRSLPGKPIHPAAHHPLPGVPGLWSNFHRGGFLEVIQRGIDYVHAGDCFQVNLSQRLLAASTIPPLELYRRLRQCNPAPFAGYLDTGDFVIASASPERFVRMNQRQVETRPIKGTRPRGRTPAEDSARAAELLASPKDRAENVMIIDLLRNDLGRVCEYGSVRVAAVCRLESYRTVHHLVSEVHGRLRPGLDGIDLLRAAFPGGSVTGAPKVRAMEIIAELEPTVRGPYCGSLGYLGFDGSMDTSILIRTFTIGKGWVQFPVGGGIVADSTPEGEYAETLHKAEGLLRALDVSG
jgi:para-aminobenzoate synthetase component 1